MPTLAFSIQADYDEAVKMREEVARLEAQLLQLGKNASPEVVKQLENELASCKGRMTEITSKAQLAGAAFDDTAKVMKQLGKSFDVSSTEKQFAALDKVINSNEYTITKLVEAIDVYKGKQQEAFEQGDFDAANKNNQIVAERTKRLQELIAQTNEYKSALSSLKTIQGQGTQQDQERKVVSVELYDTEASYKAMKQLKDEVDELQKKITTFKGSSDGLEDLKTQLEEAKGKLSQAKGEAADAATKLGAELGGRASEASSKLYELNEAIAKTEAAITQQKKVVAAASQELSQAKIVGDPAQIEAARMKYEQTASTLTNLENELRNATAAQQDASNAWNRTSEEVDRANSTIVKLLGGQEKYNTIIAGMPPLVRSAAQSITGMTGAAKAFIATPLGAVLAAIALVLKTVQTYFESSAEGQMKFAKISGYVSGVLTQLKEVVIKVGEYIVGIFENPKQAIKDFGQMMIDSVINRFKAVGGIAKSVGEIISSAFSGNMNGVKTAFGELTNQAAQLATGIEDAGNKMANYADGVKKAAEWNASLSEREEALHRRRSKWQIEEAEIDNKIAEARKKMYTAKSDAERIKAAKNAQDLLNKKYDERISQAAEELAIIKERNSLATNAQKDYDAEYAAQAALQKLEAERNSQQAMFARREASAERKGETAEEKSLKAQMKLNNELMALKLNNQKEELDIMEDGTQKKLKLIEYEYEKTLEAIEKQRGLWKQSNKEAGVKDVDKTTGLTEEQSTALKEQGDIAAKARAKAEKDVVKELVKEHQDYADKRIEIEKKYNDDIAALQEARVKAKADGNTALTEQISRSIAVAEHDKGKELMQLDFSELQKNPDYIRAFENLSETSTGTLENLIKLFEEAKQSAAENLNPEDLQAYTDAIAKMTDEVASRNPFEALAKSKEEAKAADKEVNAAQKEYNAIKGNGNPEEEAKALDKLNKAKDKQQKANAKVRKSENAVKDVIDGLSNSIKAVGDSIGGTAGEVLNLVGDIANFGMTCMSATSATAEGTSAAIQACEKASVILAIIGAALQIAQKIFSLFAEKDTYAEYQEAAKTYENYINILDGMIDKQLEFAATLSADNAHKVFEQARAYAKDAAETARTMGKQYLNSGAKKGFIGIGSEASKGTKQYEAISGDAWTSAANALGMGVEQFKSMLGGRVTGLFDLTNEQLQTLHDNASLFWASLDDDTSKWANQILKSEEQIGDILEEEIKNATRIDVDGMMDDFSGLFGEMDNSSKDFANKFEEYMKDAILNGMIKDEYQAKLEKWRKKFNERLKGGLTDSEYASLKEEGELLAEEMKERQKELKEMYGWNTSDEQSGGSSSFQAMSQDTGDELNGRFTALQIAGERIASMQTDMTASVLEIKTSLAAMSVNNTAIKSIADDTRTIISQSYLELQQIRENTEEIIAPIKQIQADMAKVKENTSRL